MGCTASKLDNEDTVRRCKERCRLMKEAVYARHHLAAAHSDYFRSLRLTGSALVSFAAGESFSVSEETPAVFLRTPSSASTAVKTPLRPPPVRIPSPSPSFHEPPPPQHFSHSSPSPSIPRSFSSQRHQLQLPQPRRKKSMKLPHILSDSSLPATPRTNNFFKTYNAKAGSTYSTTPSQASSVWNWENFYPPSPPSSEYFEQLQKNKAPPRDHLDDDVDDDKSSSNSQFPPTIPRDNAAPFKQYDFFDDQSVHDEKASVHSSYSHHSKGNLRNQGQILQNRNHLRHRSDWESEAEKEDMQYSNRNLRNQDHILKNPHHLRHRSDWESEVEGEEVQYSHRNLPNQDQILQNRHHLHHKSNWVSEAEREDLQYSNANLRNQDPILQSHHHLPRRSNWESEAEREEVQCSEWEDHDHYSSTSSSSSDLEEDGEDKEELRSETHSNYGSSSVKNDEAAASTATKLRSNPKNYSVRESDGGSPSTRWGNGSVKGEMESEKRMVVRHKNLSEIAAAIKAYFDMAASAGDQVGEMLEAGREQLDRNFKQMKKRVYHSSGILSSLSSSWSSKPPLAVKYQLEPISISGRKSLCSTLDRLLAWEKKLYQEVKAREGAKIEHEKKLATLQSLEYRGGDVAKLDKTKASINKLQSLIAVTSEAVTTTSSATLGLRESDLIPQLVELCHGFMYMWRSMHQLHDAQNDVVLQVRGLVNRATRQSTSDLHRQATRDLESAVSAWHSSFCRLIKFQRDFICSVHGWFKLSLLPVNSEPIRVCPPSEAFSFCDEWKLALDRVPDTVASEAIKSFINVVHSIFFKQGEELKIKKRTESVAKELEKKEASIRSLERKFYNQYSTVGINLPDRGSDAGLELDARDPLAEKKAELQSWQRRVEDEMVKHLKAVEVTRAMTLNNIQTGLPPVFQAMTSFSALFTEVLEAVCSRSYSI